MSMKQYIYTFLAGCTLAAMMSCQDLDLNPLSSGSSETWNSTEDEIVMSLRDLYRDRFWPQDSESWTDDYTNRDVTSVVINGTLNGQTYEVTDLWDAQYKMISRANTVIQNAHRALNSGLSQAKVDQYVAEARFLRACAYSHLTEKFGDVPYVTDLLTIEEAFAYGRTPLAEVNQHIYEDFDAAIELLPEKYKEDQRATRWLALGFKARHALYMGDYALAAAAAKEVIENGPYTLHKEFGDLFVSTPKSSNKDEAMFIIPRSVELKLNVIRTQPYLPRTSGGYGICWPLSSAPTVRPSTSLRCLIHTSPSKTETPDARLPSSSLVPTSWATAMTLHLKQNTSITTPLDCTTSRTRTRASSSSMPRTTDWLFVKRWMRPGRCLDSWHRMTTSSCVWQRCI